MALGNGRNCQDALRVTKAWETQNNHLVTLRTNVMYWAPQRATLGVSPSSLCHYSFSGDCPLRTPASLFTVTGDPQTAGRAGPLEGKQGKGLRCGGRTRSANASPGSPLHSQPAVSRGAVQGAQTLDSHVICPGLSVLVCSVEANCALLSGSL